jgi:hypothetical protein
MSMALIAELTETLARPGVLGLAGRRIEKRCREDLQRYFAALGKEIVELHLERVVEHVTKETARHSVEISVGNILRHRQPVLVALLEQNLADAMLKGDRVHQFAEADDTSDDPADPFAIPSNASPAMLTGDEAALWASIHAGEQVSGINDTTMELIANAVEQGIEDNLGVPGTARLIKDVIDTMTTSRSQMIASTEMNSAFSEATLRKLDRLNVEYKQWITSPGNVCDECSENEDASPIPLDEDFPSGDSAPPAHPNCRCAVTGARSPEAA